MEHMDVPDLPEVEARFIATCVAFLRRRKQTATQPQAREAAVPTPLGPFAVWPLGVKGTLSREDIYDYR